MRQVPRQGTASGMLVNLATDAAAASVQRRGWQQGLRGSPSAPSRRSATAAAIARAARGFRAILHSAGACRAADRVSPRPALPLETVLNYCESDSGTRKFERV